MRPREGGIYPISFSTSDVDSPLGERLALLQTNLAQVAVGQEESEESCETQGGLSGRDGRVAQFWKGELKC